MEVRTTDGRNGTVRRFGFAVCSPSVALTGWVRPGVSVVRSRGARARASPGVSAVAWPGSPLAVGRGPCSLSLFLGYFRRRPFAWRWGCGRGRLRLLASAGQFPDREFPGFMAPT